MFEKERSIETKLELQKIELKELEFNKLASNKELNCYKIGLIIGIWIMLIFCLVSMFMVV